MWGCLWQPKLTVHTKKKKEIHFFEKGKKRYIGRAFARRKKKRKEESEKRKEKERASEEEEHAATGLYMRFY